MDETLRLRIVRKIAQRRSVWQAPFRLTGTEHEHARRRQARLSRIPGDRHRSAKAFYGAAFGWKFQDYGPEYAAFNEGLDGGFNADTGTDAITAPLPVLYATDLEALLARVEAAGGVIVKPIFAFPGGRRFHFRDPAGTELAAWSE